MNVYKIYKEKLLAALLQIRHKASGQRVQNMSDTHDTDAAQQTEEAAVAILREHPADSLQKILLVLNEVIQSTGQTMIATDAQPGVEPEHVNEMWDRFQQALLEQKTEINDRLAMIESKLQSTDNKVDTAQLADELANAKHQIEELSRQREELQTRNREQEREIGSLYDRITIESFNRAEIATSNQPRVDELGRKFVSLYNQEVRDLQRTWDEFLVANDPTWDGKELSIPLKTSIRVAIAHAMTQYGLHLKTKRLSIRTNELCQAIESLSPDQQSINQARTLLLEQLTHIAKENDPTIQPSFKTDEVVENILDENRDAAAQLVQDVLRDLGKQELGLNELTDSLLPAVMKTLETAWNLVKQIFSSGGEVWLAEKDAAFDPALHERSKISAEDGVISKTEWPGYRVDAKVIKPAIVITEPQNVKVGITINI